jgi:hypothetical protein
MAMVNQILIWENGKKIGWQGPYRCVICKIEEETINHFFVNCSFAKKLWREVLH